MLIDKTIKQVFVFTVCLFICFPSISLAQGNLSRYEIKMLLRHKIDGIMDIAENRLVIDEVKRQNALNKSLEEIKQIDQAWVNSGNDHPIKKTMSQSTVGRYLKHLIEFNESIYNEAFLTDNQGANVAAFPVTTDYWQGDEDKWIKAYNMGHGDIYIGNLEFDKSTNTNALQISVPVIDNHKAIGVLVVGIKLTYLQAKYLNK